MNRQIWSSVILIGLTGGCELVAGIQDRYLVADGGDPGSAVDEASRTPGGDSAGDSPVAPGADGATVDVAPADPDAASAVDGVTGVDAASTADADTVIDAATIVDAGSGNDAPFDAGTADPSLPCAQQPGAYLFCEDFDKETTIAQDWEYSISSVDGGSLGFYAGAYTSPPRSMQVISPSPTPGQVELGEQLTSLNNRFSLAFDFRIDMATVAGIPVTGIAQVIGHRQGVAMQLNYEITASGALLQGFLSGDGGGPSTMVALPLPPLHQWTRIVVAYDAIAGLTVYQNGAVVGTNATTGGAPGPMQIQVGVVFEEIPGGSTALQFEMDNIVFRGN